MKRHNSGAEQASTSKEFKYGERSEYLAKSVMNYDETLYNVLTMAEKGFVNDSLPIRTGCFSPDGMYFAIGTNSKCIKI